MWGVMFMLIMTGSLVFLHCSYWHIDAEMAGNGNSYGERQEAVYAAATSKAMGGTRQINLPTLTHAGCLRAHLVGNVVDAEGHLCLLELSIWLILVLHGAT